MIEKYFPANLAPQTYKRRVGSIVFCDHRPKFEMYVRGVGKKKGKKRKKKRGEFLKIFKVPNV